MNNFFRGSSKTTETDTFTTTIITTYIVVVTKFHYPQLRSKLCYENSCGPYIFTNKKTTTSNAIRDGQ
jgi:hypothetical protein